MVGYSLRGSRSNNVRVHVRRGIPAWPDSGAVVIQRGLSVVVGGYTLDIVRDDVRRTATVRVSPVVVGPVPDDVREAAVMLVERTGRFLGPEWVVAGLSGSGRGEAPGNAPGACSGPI